MLLIIFIALLNYTVIENKYKHTVSNLYIKQASLEEYGNINELSLSYLKEHLK
jgi:hypothetical protein